MLFQVTPNKDLNPSIVKMKFKINDDQMPIRLVHINTVPKSYGQLKGQLGYISRHGFEVWCISSPEPELERIGKQEGVYVHSISMRRNINPLHDVVSAYRIFKFLLKLQEQNLQ